MCVIRECLSADFCLEDWEDSTKAVLAVLTYLLELQKLKKCNLKKIFFKNRIAVRLALKTTCLLLQVSCKF